MRPGNESSAHVVLGRDGRLNISVPFDSIAYHAAAGNYNRSHLSIEFCKAIPIDVGEYTLAQYEQGARLIRFWAERYSFALNRATIKGHSEIQTDRSDPGPLFDWARLLQ